MSTTQVADVLSHMSLIARDRSRSLAVAIGAFERSDETRAVVRAEYGLDDEGARDWLREAGAAICACVMIQALAVRAHEWIVEGADDESDDDETGVQP
jgi:hypothetical protein